MFANTFLSNKINLNMYMCIYISITIDFVFLFLLLPHFHTVPAILRCPDNNNNRISFAAGIYFMFASTY